MAASERRPDNHCPSRRKHKEEKYNEKAILGSFQKEDNEDNEDNEENVARINIKQNLQGLEGCYPIYRVT